MILSILLTLLTTVSIFIGALLLAFLLIIITWLILKPYFLYCFYKEQGAQGYFKPNAGFFRDRFKDMKEKGDYMHYFKQNIQRNPDIKVIATNMGSQVLLYLVDPYLIKEFTNLPQYYKKADIIAGIQGLFEEQGILFSESDHWKKDRKIFSTAIHHEFLREQVPLMTKTIEDNYNGIESSNSVDSTVDITELNKKIAGDILGQLYFGHCYMDYCFEGKSITQSLGSMLQDGYKEMFTVWNTVFGAWFINTGILERHEVLMERIEGIRKTFKNIIRETKKRNNSHDNKKENSLLTSLLKLQNIQRKKYSMTDKQIIDNFISLFAAGVDTTAHLCSMALYYLTQNPEVYCRIANELEQIISNEEINFEKIQKLEYTHAVIKETLRKANPQGFLILREAIQDHHLGQFYIKEGTLVNFSPIFNGENPKYFSDNEKFYPERWLPGAEKSQALQDNPFASIPFSAGPRNCVGNHIAVIEVKVMLICLLRKYKVELDKGYNLKMTYTTNYVPAENIRVKLIPKN